MSRRISTNAAFKSLPRLVAREAPEHRSIIEDRSRRISADLASKRHLSATNKKPKMSCSAQTTKQSVRWPERRQAIRRGRHRSGRNFLHVPARPAAVGDGQKLSGGQHNVATFHPFVHKVARYAVHTQTPLLSTGTEHPSSTVYRSASAPVCPPHHARSIKHLFLRLSGFVWEPIIFRRQKYVTLSRKIEQNGSISAALYFPSVSRCGGTQIFGGAASKP